MSLYHQGENEWLKGGVHGALLTLSCLAFNHNVMASRERPDPNLRFNCWFYALVIGVEIWQVYRHIKEGE